MRQPWVATAHGSMVFHHRLDGLSGLSNFTEFLIILRG